jgi:hypothetical protein
VFEVDNVLSDTLEKDMAIADTCAAVLRCKYPGEAAVTLESTHTSTTS